MKTRNPGEAELENNRKQAAGSIERLEFDFKMHWSTRLANAWADWVRIKRELGFVTTENKLQK